MSQSPYRDPSASAQASVIVTTGLEIPDHRVTQILAIVRGVSVRRPSESSGPKLDQRKVERSAAEARMVAEAETLRAHAVIGMRYDSCEDEVVAYGTAVLLDRIRPHG